MFGPRLIWSNRRCLSGLGERVVGARVLELFAGTGALSFECLSRGSGLHALCVEKSQRHAAVLRQNFDAAGFPSRSVAGARPGCFYRSHPIN